MITEYPLWIFYTNHWIYSITRTYVCIKYLYVSFVYSGVLGTLKKLSPYGNRYIHSIKHYNCYIYLHTYIALFIYINIYFPWNNWHKVCDFLLALLAQNNAWSQNYMHVHVICYLHYMHALPNHNFLNFSRTNFFFDDNFIKIYTHTYW